MASADDYYEGVTEETQEVLNRQMTYVTQALVNGDVAYVEKPGQVTIRIRVKKGKTM